MKAESTRSNQQNKALHKYFDMLADALNAAGLDMKKVFEVKTVDVPWNKNLVKEALWRPIQEAMTDKESTTELTTVDPSEIYETLNRHIAENFGVHVPFPRKPDDES